MYIDKNFYECPTCGKKYSSFEDLSKCILKDAEAIKGMRAEKEKRSKENTYAKKVADAKAELQKAFQAFSNVVDSYNSVVKIANRVTGNEYPLANISLTFSNENYIKKEKDFNYEDTLKKFASDHDAKLSEVKNDLEQLINQIFRF